MSAVLQVKVVPGAGRDRVAGRYGEGLKVQVTAPPEKGKANEAVVQVLAAALSLRPSQVAIVSGQGSPRKTVRIEGMGQDELHKKLADF